MKVQNFKLNEEGLNRFFGPLEACIMEYIWTRGEVTAKEVQQKIEYEKPLNFNTVTTVMNRLAEKDLLHKETNGRRSRYQVSLTKEEFLKIQTKEVAYELMREFGEFVITHFIDTLEEVNPQTLRKLEEKINQWKKEK